MNKGTLVIFAKTSQLSAVKTRLAQSIGQSKAKQCYDLMLKVVEQISEKIQEKQNNIDIYWALAEKKAVNHPTWKNKNVLWAKKGSLGDQLNFVYQDFIKKYDFVLILGSDNPDISVELLIAIIDKFKHKKTQTIIGPAKDGGFYFFASNEKIDQKIWLNVKYSQPDTLNQLTNQLKKFTIQYQISAKNIDIDTLEDLVELKKNWQTKKNLLAAQKKLNQWIAKNID